MSPVYTSHDSWWLKFKRAQRHMVEIRHALRAYAKANPYSPTCIKDPKRERKRRPIRWHYVLNLDPPNEMFTLMLGDFIHNIRSALDHVAVANSRPDCQKSAGFPLETRDIFALNERWEFIHPDRDARKSFNRMIEGMHFLAKTVVIESQPYRSVTPVSHILGLISRLENLDKHRQLVATGAGLRGGAIHTAIRGVPYRTDQLGRHQFFNNHAEIFSFEVINPQLTEAEVDVKCTGSATINVEAAGIEGQPGNYQFSPVNLILQALAATRIVLRAMDGAARSDAMNRADFHSTPPQ